MKKIIATTFCTLMLCSLLLITGTVMAAEPGYVRYSHPTQVIPILDGTWTTDDEWTDGEETWIGEDVVFRSTLDSDISRWIVEFLTDTTDDPGDYLRFCIDVGSGTDYSAPEITFHRKFEITEHTNLFHYFGDRGDWSLHDHSYVEWAASLSASPTSSTPHWIYEIQIYKTVGVIPIEDIWYFFLQVYDASNPEFHAWPPTDPDVPEDWGMEDYSPEPIPEFLSFGVMVLLTTLSMLVGYKYFVKRKETKAQ